MNPTHSAAKRVRLSMSSRFDDVPDIDKVRDQSEHRLKSRFESIFNKYERDFSEIGDIIDLESGQVVVDNGHLGRMRNDRDTGTRHTGSRRVILGPDCTDYDELASTMRFQKLSPLEGIRGDYFRSSPFNQQQYTPQMVAMPVMMPSQTTPQFDPAQMQKYIDERIAEHFEAYARSRYSNRQDPLHTQSHAWRIPDLEDRSQRNVRAHRHLSSSRHRRSLPIMSSQTRLSENSPAYDSSNNSEDETVWRTGLHDDRGSESETGSNQPGEQDNNDSTQRADVDEAPTLTDPSIVQGSEVDQNSAIPGQKQQFKDIRATKIALQRTEKAKSRKRGRPRKNLQTAKPSNQTKCDSDDLRLATIGVVMADTGKSSSARASLKQAVDGDRGNDLTTSHNENSEAREGTKQRRQFTEEEDRAILRLLKEFGPNWEAIAPHFPNRSSRTLYGRWKKYLRTDNPSTFGGNKLLNSETVRTTSGARDKLRHLQNGRRNRRHSEPVFLKPPIRTHSPWSSEDTQLLIRLRDTEKLSWNEINLHFPSKSLGAIRGQFCHAIRTRNSKPGQHQKKQNGISISPSHRHGRDPPQHETSAITTTTDRVNSLENKSPLIAEVALNGEKHNKPKYKLSDSSSRSKNNRIRPMRVDKTTGSNNTSTNDSMVHDSFSSAHECRIDKVSEPVDSETSSAKQQSLRTEHSTPLIHSSTTDRQDGKLRDKKSKASGKRKRQWLNDIEVATGNTQCNRAEVAKRSLPNTPHNKLVDFSTAPAVRNDSVRSLPEHLIIDEDLGSEDELH